MTSQVRSCDPHRILSVRELRTLLAMVSELPLHLGVVHSFESLLRECDNQYNGTRPTVDPIEYETHYDPNLVSFTTRLLVSLLVFISLWVHTHTHTHKTETIVFCAKHTMRIIHDIPYIPYHEYIICTSAAHLRR